MYVIRDCADFEVYSVCHLQRHPLDQSDAKLKPMTTWSPALQFACFDFEFLVALEGIFLSSDSPFSLLWFSFTKLDREALFYVILVLLLSVCL